FHFFYRARNTPPPPHLTRISLILRRRPKNLYLTAPLPAIINSFTAYNKAHFELPQLDSKNEISSKNFNRFLEYANIFVNLQFCYITYCSGTYDVTIIPFPELIYLEGKNSKREKYFIMKEKRLQDKRKQEICLRPIPKFKGNSIKIQVTTTRTLARKKLVIFNLTPCLLLYTINDLISFTCY
uniref:Uncharacterized protein n=1 Tax=Glossina palpalis gambiensis TaxID=67801 RepID=A0A1B0ATS1_9MUSC